MYPVCEMGKVAQYLRAAKDKTPVDPSAYREIFRASAKFEETRHPKKYKWMLVRDVPIAIFQPPSLDDYTSDPDVTEEEMDENVERYNYLYKLLIERGEKPWPVVVAPEGLVLDGYHRLAVLFDADRETVDVLWAASRR